MPRKDDSTLPRLTLSERQRLDLEQILCGGFAPLKGFLNEADYHSVVERMRLSDGALWPMPIVLDVPKKMKVSVGEKYILCDVFGNPLSRFTVGSAYEPDKKAEAKAVYGTTSREHPGVKYLFEETGEKYLGGPVELIAYSPAHDFKELRHTPQSLKEEFKKRGWKKIVAFQTRNPMHRAHYEIVKRSAEKAGAKILLHPVAGLTKEGDIDYVSRVRSYKRLREKRMGDNVMLAILPLAMRMAGPREALWHALIRKNYGATHFIVGRDHAGLGKNSRDSSGKSFYEPYASQELVKKNESEIGIGIMPAAEITYVEDENAYLPSNELKPHHKVKNISGTEFRKMLREGGEVPEWFSFPEVVEELRRAVLKEKRRGAVVFFTGLSGAGKSTIAHVLYHKLLEVSDRPVTLLDGDVVRAHLSKGLGFSKEDRDTNIGRIGFVAGEIAKAGGIAICAAIAPYKEAREKNRQLIEKQGTYIEVYVDTPIAVCEKRDTKGLYEKAHRGMLKNFTGVNAPYEAPEDAELSINTTDGTPEEYAGRVMRYLEEAGLV
ncbi:bifunctional sulfate adenylyltransferase/adenylylsulfate kinase [Candidatus Kaiserbacteria bacterium]|nr:bifunctional sulfate adenylyltransferase/adenylylsulfate kinase [Candidatus Kaiserbacteria bacterium]